MLIGIAGKAGSGKSTFTHMLEEELYAVGRGAISSKFGNQMSFAAPVYEIASILTRQSVEWLKDNKQVTIEHLQNRKVREVLQQIGTEIFRSWDKELWVKIGMHSCSKHSRAINIFDDLRFHNEAQAIRDRGGILIRMIGRASNPDNEHESETGLDEWTGWDYIVDNSGELETLERQASRIVGALLSRAGG